MLASCQTGPEPNDAASLSTDTLVAQEDTLDIARPSDADMISAVRGQILHFKGDNLLDPRFIEGEQLQWIPAHLSPSEEPQGFAIATVEISNVRTRYAVAMQAKNGAWQLGHGPELYAENFRVVDVDNDGVDEVYVEKRGEGQGIVEMTYQLLNLEKAEPRILWQASGMDRTDMLPLVPIGDTLRKVVAADFEQEDENGNKVLMTRETASILKALNGFTPVTRDVTELRYYSFQRGRYQQRATPPEAARR